MPAPRKKPASKVRTVRSAEERTGSRGRYVSPKEKRARAQAVKELEEEGVTAKPISAAHRRRLAREGRSPGRRCGGTNLAGKPCGASPLREGTEIDGVPVSGDWCLFHDPDVPADAWRRFVQEKGTEAIRQKPRQIPAMELLAQAVAKTPEILFKAHLGALGLEWDPDTRDIVPLEGEAALGATHVGFSREGVARKSKLKNVDTHMRAEREIMDRLFGKARQAMELATAGNNSSVVVPVTIERAQIVSSVLRDAGAIPGLGPAAPSEVEGDED